MSKIQRLQEKQEAERIKLIDELTPVTKRLSEIDKERRSIDALTPEGREAMRALDQEREILNSKANQLRLALQDLPHRYVVTINNLRQRDAKFTQLIDLIHRQLRGKETGHRVADLLSILERDAGLLERQGELDALRNEIPEDQLAPSPRPAMPQPADARTIVF